MEDERIIELYWERSENAIAETAKKYGKYCRSIAYRILQNEEDCEECVNDAYLRLWDSMPPHRPQELRTYLGKLVRNLALDRYDWITAKKRGDGQFSIAAEELAECLSAAQTTESVADELALAEVLNRFLASLPGERRRIFMQRYWYFRTVREIAGEFHMGESRVKMILLRAREQLKNLLEEEGIAL